MNEARVYGPDCSEADREALLARVKLVGDNIILYREVPIISHFQTDLMFDQVQTLAEIKKLQNG